MLKRLAGTAVLLATVSIGAVHAAPPADQDACYGLAFNLAEKAANKKLPEADAVKVDGLIAKIESQCGESKFADAETTAKDVEAALAK